MENEQNEMKTHLALNTFGPLSESVGQTLNDIWSIVFGSVHYIAERKNLSREKAFLRFKETLERNITEIPAGDIKEPKICILGPALEASKYYFEEETLRNMFAALIAATMDRRKEHILHPGFPEIIKQMSPLDAQNLSLFTTQLPVVEYYRQLTDFSETMLTNIFIANKDMDTDEESLKLQSQSISSLARLGLISVEYEKRVLENKFYQPFTETRYYKRHVIESGKAPGIRQGRARVTPFGQSFIAVCLPRKSGVCQ